MPDVLDGIPSGIEEFGARINQDVSQGATAVRTEVEKTTTAMSGQAALAGSRALQNAVRTFATAEDAFITDAESGGQIYNSVASVSANDYESTSAQSAQELQSRVEGLQESLQMSGRDVGDRSYTDAVRQTPRSHMPPIQTPVR